MLSIAEIIKTMQRSWWVQELALPSEVYDPPFVRYLTNGSESVLIELKEVNLSPPERVNWQKEGF